jgi:hypothetical protein
MAKVPEVLLRWRERVDRASRTDPRYDEDAFRRIKVHYLREHPAERPQGRRRLGRRARRQGVRPRAAGAGGHGARVRRARPRKIGQTIHDAPVIAPDGVAEYRGAFAVAAVGLPNARDEIRAALGEQGWVEGKDFVAVA